MLRNRDFFYFTQEVVHPRNFYYSQAKNHHSHNGEAALIFSVVLETNSAQPQWKTPALEAA